MSDDTNEDPAAVDFRRTEFPSAVEIQLDEGLQVFIDKKSAWQTQVFTVEHLNHIGNRNTQLLHPDRIKVHPDRTSQLPSELNFAHSVNRLEPLLYHVACVLV